MLLAAAIQVLTESANPEFINTITSQHRCFVSGQPRNGLIQSTALSHPDFQNRMSLITANRSDATGRGFLTIENCRCKFGFGQWGDNFSTCQLINEDLEEPPASRPDGHFVRVGCSGRPVSDASTQSINILRRSNSGLDWHHLTNRYHAARAVGIDPRRRDIAIACIYSISPWFRAWSGRSGSTVSPCCAGP